MTTTSPSGGPYGVPPHELSDAELEHQGTRAHATRHTVFLHGTAEQFRHHTERMLELEQEYLRRHPKRTWQGTHADGEVEELSDVDRWTRVRQTFRLFTEAMEELLSEALPNPPDTPSEPGDRERSLLARFASVPGGRLHKLEAHQVAREVGAHPARVAALYRHDPPFLVAEGSDRVLTDAGRALQP